MYLWGTEEDKWRKDSKKKITRIGKKRTTMRDTRHIPMQRMCGSPRFFNNYYLAKAYIVFCCRWNCYEHCIRGTPALVCTSSCITTKQRHIS